MSKQKSSDAGYVPDITDQKIIEELRNDGRAANSLIASRLDLTEGTIRQRIKNLLRRGVLKISGLVNPESLVDYQIALIGINVKESNLLDEKACEIADLPEVLSVSIAAGRYDIFAEIKIPSNSGLIDFLSESLPKVEGVASTESFLMLKSIKKWV